MEVVKVKTFKPYEINKFRILIVQKYKKEIISFSKK